MTTRTILAALVVALVGAAIAAGFAVMGPPSEARARRVDERRVNEVRQLASDIDLFWSRRGVLPASLEELASEPGMATARTDPETGVPYAYRVLEESRYEVCGVFATETASAGVIEADRFWAHGGGLQCFEIAAETAERSPGRAAPSGPGRGGV